MSLNPSLFTSRRPIGVPLAGITVLLAALTACGGGGDASTPMPDTPVANNLDLTGTAAVGKALAGATVTAKCATGTNTATAGADGVFRLAISGGVLPCVLQAVSGSTTLHSVATGTGRSATANISPLTELVVAHANGGDAATLFSSFDAAAQAKVSSSALSAATTSVQTALASVVDIAGVNPFTDSLVAATGSSAGNALDAKLDTLGSKLGAAKLTLAQLLSAIVRNGSAAAAVVKSQVQPAASHCASLRSGSYVVLNPSEDAANLVHQVTLDAVTLTSRTASTSGGADEVSPAVVPVAGKPCHYRSADGREDLVVSTSGVIVNRYLVEDGSVSARLGLGIPRQTIAAADLAGTWNTVGLLWGGGAVRNDYTRWTVDASGTSAVESGCAVLGACDTGTAQLTIAVNPAGGFDVRDGDGLMLRLFAFRAIGGELMLAALSPNGGLVFASRPTALALPVVGDAQTYWDLSMNAQQVTGNLFGDVRTITAVETVARSYTRSPSFTGLIDGFTINSPRDGLRQRATCINSSGATVSCGLIAMPLTGMGMTVYGGAVTNGNFLGISVARPAGSTSTGVQSSDTSASAGTAVPGTLVVTGGETYPLRASMTISSAGQITGGQYDFHKLDGTMTACEHSAANDATCHGTSAFFSVTSQSGAMTTAGSSNGISLVAGPDIYGYTYTGTLLGVRWTGTWTKVATGSSTLTGSGSFSVDLVITQP